MTGLPYHLGGCAARQDADMSTTVQPKTPEQLQRWADALAIRLTPQERGYLAASLAMERARKKAVQHGR